ncbi:MAG: tetratricopeptide repeat protein [Deltaproteobacteria bacterium]|nr:tetratricopeptide repeat protein [Deltaproteobacteria bacterium]
MTPRTLCMPQQITQPKTNWLSGGITMNNLIRKTVLWSVLVNLTFVSLTLTAGMVESAPVLLQLGPKGEVERQITHAISSRPDDQGFSLTTASPSQKSFLLAQADPAPEPRREDPFIRRPRGRLGSAQERELQKLYNLGVDHFFAGLYDQAIARFNEALAIDPEFAEAYFNRGLVFALKKQDTAAVADFTRALQFEPLRADIYYQRGAALTRLEQFSRAISDFNKALEISPNSPEIYQARDMATAKMGKSDHPRPDPLTTKEGKEYSTLPPPAPAPVLPKQPEMATAARSSRDSSPMLTAKSSLDLRYMPQFNQGVEYFFSGQHDLAIAAFNQVLADNPDFTEAYFNRGLIYALQGKEDRAIADFNQVLLREPRRVEVFYNRGMSYSRLKQFEKAIADYNRALELSPQNSEVYRLRGIAYSKMGRNDLARADFSKAEEVTVKKVQVAREGGEMDLFLKVAETLKRIQRPDSPQINKGLACLEKGQLEQALTEFNQAVAVNPKDAIPYFLRGLILAKQGKTEDAISNLTSALQLNPRFSRAFGERGVLQARKGQYQLALSDLGSALGIDPSYAEAYNNRGSVYSQMNQTELALIEYNRALAINPLYAKAYYNRGSLNLVMGNYDQALADLDKAQEFDPHDARVYVNRGLAYAGKRRYDRALADFTIAVELNPKMAIANYHRAVALEKTGRRSEAIEAYQEFLQHASPDLHEQIEEARRKIGAL